MTARPRNYLLIALGLIGLLIGSLSASDLFAHAVDPADVGPLAVTREEYSYGTMAFTPTDFPGPVELTASVHYPTSLSGGPFPLVVFLHGRHRTCYDGVTAVFEWPCSPPRKPIPAYQGFDYIAGVLASHGYVVVSISANGISARDDDTPDFGMLARAELIQKHLDFWQTFNTTGAAPFGTKFVGKVNLNNVGTVGHSAGGEGAARHFFFNAGQPAPYGVKAVFTLAPGNGLRLVLNNVPLAVLVPYCDGIATEADGVHFFDDARYSSPGDEAAKHMFVVMGANHNYYNTVWTPPSSLAPAVDDWSAFVAGGSADPHCGIVPGNKRLTAAQQRGTGLAYVTGFLRTHLGGETAFLPMLRGDAPPPPSAMTDAIHVSSHAPDNPALRRDVNRLLDANHLATNTLGGAVSQVGITPYDLCGGEAPQPQHCLPGQPTARQPHTAPSELSSKRGLSQLRGGWNSAAAIYVNDLPAGFRDVSGFQALQFRASVNFADPRNPAGQAQDFSVELVDGMGSNASVNVSDWSSALFYPPGAIGPVPKVILNAVRIPLGAFSGVNFGDIRSVRFSFDQHATGALLISDIAFADQAVPGGSPIALSRTFSCGASSFAQNAIGVSDHGAIAQFASPGGHQHISVSARSGYQVCYATGVGGPFFTSFDFGGTQSGWAPGVDDFQPNGPGTFPLEITRTTADGRIRVTRRFTGNSFVAAVPPGNALDLGGDGQACSTMGECGNCSNRTIHVLTRVENLTGGNLLNIAVVELIDLSINGTDDNDRFVRTGDSIIAYEDLGDGGSGEKVGLLVQSMLVPAETGVLPAGGYVPSPGCAPGSAVTPTAPGNFEGVLKQSFGTLGPGANTGNNIRTHFRRF